MNTITSSWMRRIAAGAVLAAAPAMIALGAAPASHAATDPGMGCETIHWGFLGSDRRQICDGPKQSDGSWQRTRTIFTPAYIKPFKCSHDSFLDNTVFANNNFSCSGGYQVPQTTETQESYVVTPGTVLPDEPGWLPPGTNNIL